MRVTPLLVVVIHIQSTPDQARLCVLPVSLLLSLLSTNPSLPSPPSFKTLDRWIRWVFDERFYTSVSSFDFPSTMPPASIAQNPR